MNRERYEQISELFLEACELEGGQREALLEKRCGGDAELRAAVEALLQYDTTHHDDPLSEDALRAGLQFGTEPARAPSAESVTLPERIGHYRILGKIGEGGMGAVYLAEQDRPRRRVALKMIRPGILSQSLLRRFQLETDVLGRLQHPGIAQIYEAGEANLGAGRQPYFAMEYVEGVELRRYAKQQNLGTRDRLALVARVCDAVHHAHQKGIIHRDLKPDNVLVVQEPAATVPGDAAEFATLGQPKVLDFGVARATDSDIQMTTVRTDVGELVGTLTYMSPEQVAGDSRALDTRSDLYALGVMLYELLAGHPPFATRCKSIPETVRIIREEEPTRLGSIRATFRGDIDTIVGKALEKDPAHRYQSAAELAADIRRYLANEPIIAHPPSTFYQLRKFAKRNRALVGGLAMSVLILLAGVVSSLVLATRALRGERLARESEMRASASETASRRTAYQLSLATADAVGGTDPVQALQHLQTAPAEYRGWEWNHLRARFEGEVARYTGDHLTEYAYTVGTRPDGTLLAALERGGGIEVIDLQSGGLVAEFHADGGLTTPNLSPDGSLLAAVSAQARELFIWEVGSQASRLKLPLGSIDARHARFNSDGSLLALPSGEGAAVVEVATGRTRFSTAPTQMHTEYVAFDPTGRRLAVTSVDGLDGGLFYLHIYSTTGQSLVSQMFADGCEGLAFSPDGTRLAVGFFQRLIRLVDVSTLAVVSTLQGHTDRVRAVTFSPDGELLASSSADGTTRVWDLARGEVRHVVPSGYAGALAFAQANRFLVAGSTSQAQLWDGMRNARLVLRGHTSYIYIVAFSPDGSLLASSAWDDSVRIWDARTGELLGVLAAVAPYRGLCFTHDGSRVLALSGGEGIVVWDSATGVRLARPRTPADAILFDPQEDLVHRYLRAAAGGAACMIIDGLDGASSPDGGFFASPSDGGRKAISVAALASNRVVAVLGQEHGGYSTVAFGPDAARLITGGFDGAVRLWDVARGAELAVLKGHVGPVYSVSASPDGTRLVSGGNDETIRLWDTASYESVAVLRGHTSYVHCVAFSPDGTQLASGSGDGTVRIWDSFPPERRMRQTRQIQSLQREAEPLIARLLQELGDSSAVADRLRGDAALSGPLRQEALIVLLRQSCKLKPGM